jgi:hypothetical protein
VREVSRAIRGFTGGPVKPRYLIAADSLATSQLPRPVV